MIKSLVTISVLISIIFLSLGFSDIVVILLQIKGSIIFYLSMIFSRLAIFSLFAEVLHEVVVNFLKRL